MLKPVRFKGYNVEYAKDQPEYLPLPGFKTGEPPYELVTCWKGNFWDRIRFLFTGRVWIEYWTFNKDLQPTRATLNPKDTALRWIR